MMAPLHLAWSIRLPERVIKCWSHIELGLDGEFSNLGVKIILAKVGHPGYLGEMNYG
jgi:hypothetical protein